MRLESSSFQISRLLFHFLVHKHTKREKNFFEKIVIKKEKEKKINGFLDFFLVIIIIILVRIKMYDMI